MKTVRSGSCGLALLSVLLALLALLVLCTPFLLTARNASTSSTLLADRGWGLSMFIPLFAEQTGYPSWALVAPDLKVIQHGTGYGGFTAFQNAIVAHNNP